MPSERSLPSTEDIDLATLGRAVWRAKGWVAGLAVAAGFITFVGLSMVRPLYTSEARILIQNDDSTYRRPTGEGSPPPPAALDEQAIQSQVQVLSSRDLALQVVQTLDLPNNPEFAKDAGIGLVSRLLKEIGISFGSQKSEQERAANAFADHVLVYQLAQSSVIAIDYTSGDPELAAKAANALANAYIEWQRKAKLDETRDATSWLNTEIEALRGKVAESEAAVENFRTQSGIYSGTNNVDLGDQQLSELNSQLILAKAQQSEAEARALLIKRMLTDNGDIDATPEVLQSQLIGRLIEQRVEVQRQLAELSATLLPSHPRIQQLNSELADVRAQIRDEADKVVKGLENSADVASAREASLRSSLDAAKSQASGDGAAEIKLRALQREAKANEDLLQSYLARYRDASARHDVGAVPADATIVSNAFASLQPSFPKRVPITALVMVAVALLVLAYILARELINGTGIATMRLADAPEPAVPPRNIPARSTPTRRADPEPDDLAEQTAFEEAFIGTDAETGNAASAAGEPPPIRSSKDIIDRFRRSQPSPEAHAAPPRRAEPHQPLQSPAREIAVASVEAPAASSETEGTHSDLDKYLRQRQQPAASAFPAPPITIRPLRQRAGPVVKSLEALCEQIDGELKGTWPRSVLIAPVSTVNALPEAIQIAQKLVAGKGRTILLDIARGSSTVSDFMGLSRSPGFTELAANKASFEDVVQVDRETPLQVIAAGNPDLPPDGKELASFLRIFDALTQTYDCVVIHADRAHARAFEPAMEGLLSAMVALFAPDTFETEGEGHLAEFAALDCPVFIYERTSRGRSLGKASLFSRIAAN